MIGEGKESYLGDGLYARFDGFIIWLRAPLSGGDHFVGLEPRVFNELIGFARRAGFVLPAEDKE